MGAEYQVSMVVASALKGNCFSSKAMYANANFEGRQIDRSGERPVSEPLPKPISHRNPVEPQRRTDEGTEKLVALQWAEPLPSYRRRLNQVDGPHFAFPFEKRIG